MNTIKQIKAREILDSRGHPTIEAEIILNNGISGRGMVPSGASTGSMEALELRDNDPQRFLGKGVQHAIGSINDIIAPQLIGRSVDDQSAIDHQLIDLDGTNNKRHLGANAMLAVSLAATHAASAYHNIPLYEYMASPTIQPIVLPVPMINIINGGAHADNKLSIQEFMIVPVGLATFQDALRASVETFHHLKKLLSAQGYNTSVGDEGGFAPRIAESETVFDLIMTAIENAGYRPNDDICLALDVAATEFFDHNKKHYLYNNQIQSAEAMIERYQTWISHYPIISIEDGLAEDDWDGWQLMSKTLNNIQLVGDDLFVTNTERLAQGIKQNVANSILIKVNQIGTLTETRQTIDMAHHASYTTVISHRSGETEDTFIADLAVATCAKQIKTGSVSRSDRVAKYNRLLRISDALGDRQQYPGRNVFDQSQ